MNVKEIRNKTEQELKEQIVNLNKEIEDAMGKIIKGKDKNTVKVRKLRKDLARIMTVLNEQKKETSNA